MERPLLLTLLLAPALAWAQVSVPADVESVASGGFWTADQRDGISIQKAQSIAQHVLHAAGPIDRHERGAVE